MKGWLHISISADIFIIYHGFLLKDSLLVCISVNWFVSQMGFLSTTKVSMSLNLGF